MRLFQTTFATQPQSYLLGCNKAIPRIISSYKKNIPLLLPPLTDQAFTTSRTLFPFLRGLARFLSPGE
jgi:hypothetical protein